MNTNTSHVAPIDGEPPISNTHDQVPVSPLIAPDIVSTSPSPTPLMSDQQRDELLTSRREARRRRRRRRAQRRRAQRAVPEHQQQAQRMRRRHMDNQRFQQQLYYRHSQDHDDYDRCRSPTVNSFFDAVHGWDMLPRTDDWEQQHTDEFEGMAALEQLVAADDVVEPPQQIDALENWQDEEDEKPEQSAEEWDQMRLRDIERMSTSPSFHSVLDHTEQMRQIDQMERSQEARQQRQYNHDQEQLEQWEQSNVPEGHCEKE